MKPDYWVIEYENLTGMVEMDFEDAMDICLLLESEGAYGISHMIPTDITNTKFIKKGFIHISALKRILKGYDNAIL